MPLQDILRCNSWRVLWTRTCPCIRASSRASKFAAVAHTPGARRFSVVAPSSDFVAAMDDPNYWETAGLQSAFTRVR